MTLFSKSLGGMAPLPPWIRVCSQFGNYESQDWRTTLHDHCECCMGNLKDRKATKDNQWQWP